MVNCHISVGFFVCLFLCLCDITQAFFIAGKEGLMKLIVTMLVTVVGKTITPYTLNGAEKESRAVNVLQNDGQIIATLKVTDKIFSLLERGQEYLLDGEYSETKYGTSIKITGIHNATKGA